MPRYQITTPEQVHFHYDAAGLVTRAMAWLVDQVIVTAARTAVAMALAKVGGQLAIALVLVGFFVVDFGYYLMFESMWAGRSPGKRLYGIRVVSARGGRLRFPDIFIRNLLRPIDFLPALMVVGGVVALIDPMRRRLGDMAAETLVVRDARGALPEAVLSHQSRVNTFQEDVALRGRILARVTREERDLILDLTVRRDELAPSVREDIFGQAAEYFRQRYSIPEDIEHISDEQTVLNLALVVQGSNFVA